MLYRILYLYVKVINVQYRIYRIESSILFYAYFKTKIIEKFT